MNRLSFPLLSSVLATADLPFRHPAARGAALLRGGAGTPANTVANFRTRGADGRSTGHAQNAPLPSFMPCQAAGGLSWKGNPFMRPLPNRPHPLRPA